MGKSRAKIVILLAIFIILQMTTVVGLIGSRLNIYIGEVVVTTLVFIALCFLQIKYNRPLSTYLNVLIIITIAGHNFLGRYMGLYNTSSIYDRIQHIFGIYSFALFTYILMSQITNVSIVSKFREFVFIVSLGLAYGAIIEIIEFLMDTIFQPIMRNQPSLDDTDLDLVSDAIGAIIAAFHFIFYYNFKRVNTYL